MSTLHPVPVVVNPLASIIDLASPLDAAENALSLASLFAGHGRLSDAGAALWLVWPALHLAAQEAADPARLALLSRAAREADAALADAGALDVPTLGMVG